MEPRLAALKAEDLQPVLRHASPRLSLMRHSSRTATPRAQDGSELIAAQPADAEVLATAAVPAAGPAAAAGLGVAGRHSTDPLTGCDPASLEYVFATTTNLERHNLIKASRGHRQGVRLLVFTNVTGDALAAEAAEGAAHCEQWRHLPDRSVDIEGFPRPLLGELRYATAPFLAHALLSNGGEDSSDGDAAGTAAAAAGATSADSTAARKFGGTGRAIAQAATPKQESGQQGVWSAPYKWMMYGDDDTLWFMGGVAALIAGLDAEKPWFLTDNFYSSYTPGFEPRKAAVPRCVPCTLDPAGLDLTAQHAVRSCDCTPLAVCGGGWNRSAGYPCDPERPPLEGHHGGAGALLSVGLLRRAPLAVMHPCLDAHPKWLGDHAFFHCLWRAGLAHTDPGYSLRHPGALLFDALQGSTGRLAHLVNASLPLTGAAAAAAGADGGFPGQGARGGSGADVLQSMVSMHIAGSRFCSSADTARAIALVYELYDAWQEVRQRADSGSASTPRAAGAGSAAAAAGQHVRALAVRLWQLQQQGQSGQGQSECLSVEGSQLL
ncbi:hypothetical protein N2152v2_000062 [Parachlorella kessleri]